MTIRLAFASLLRDLAHRIDPYQAPPPVLPEPGDRITVVVVTAAGTEEFHGVVNVVHGRIEDGRGIGRLVLREVRDGRDDA